MPFNCEFSTAFSTAFAICDLTPVVDVPPQVLGGKGPLLRPAYDLMADLHTGGTATTIRIINDINESIERTTRQELAEVPGG